MRFAVRAIDEAGQLVQALSLDALDEQDALAQLQQRQLTPLSLRPRSRPWLTSRRSDFSAPLLAQELHALVQAGLNLVESLEALAEKERSTEVCATLHRLVGSLRSGERFSTALRAQDGMFEPLFVGIVEAAESTGELAPALERYVGYAQRVEAVRQRVISAAIYPAILISVGTLVAMFLLGWVVPRFASVYHGVNQTLPWGSQLLLDWGSFAGAHPFELLTVFIILVTTAAYVLRSVFQTGADTRMLRWIPGVAGWFDLLTLSRLFLTLGLLLRGGLPVVQALALARSVLPPERSSAISLVSARVAEGLPLSVAMDQAGLSTTISRRFIRAGEGAGQLAEMLHRAALYHEAETARWTERFVRVFEPLLMTAIGVVIGIIVILLYIPIFDLAGSLK